MKTEKEEKKQLKYNKNRFNMITSAVRVLEVIKERVIMEQVLDKTDKELVALELSIIKDELKEIKKELNDAHRL